MRAYIEFEVKVNCSIDGSTFTTQRKISPPKNNRRVKVLRTLSLLVTRLNLSTMITRIGLATIESDIILYLMFLMSWKRR